MKKFLLPSNFYLTNTTYLGLVLFLLSIILEVFSYAFGLSVKSRNISLEQPDWMWSLYVSGVAAPIVETIAIFMLFQVTVRWLSFRLVNFIFTVAVFAAAIHMDRGYHSMSMSVIAFALFSWEFRSFAISDNVLSAIVGVTITHALNNILVKLTALTFLAS